MFINAHELQNEPCLRIELFDEGHIESYILEKIFLYIMCLQIKEFCYLAGRNLAFSSLLLHSGYYGPQL